MQKNNQRKFYRNRVTMIVYDETGTTPVARTSFAMPTVESAGMLVYLLRRCAVIPFADIYQEYYTPCGFSTIGHNSKRLKTLEEYKNTYKRREESSFMRISVEVPNFIQDGTTLNFDMLFHSIEDCDIANTLLVMGTRKLKRRFVVSSRDATTKEWVSWEPSVFCRKSIATAFAAIPEENKEAALEELKKFQTNER